MATAITLIPGFKYRVVSGPLSGEIVTVVSNEPFPDNDMARRRKVTVDFDGQTAYVLPRCLADMPEGMETEAGETVTLDDIEDSAEQVEMKELAVSSAHKPITDPMDPRLDHLRPKDVKRLKREYISRNMKNGKTDVEVLLAYVGDAHRNGNGGYPVPFALKGHTQSGKTLMVQMLAIYWAELLGLPKPMPIFTLSGSAGITDFDLFGQPMSMPDPRTGKDRIVNVPGTVHMSAQAGGILYIDEINAIAERYTTSLFSILDGRHEFTNRNRPMIKGGEVMPEHVRCHPDMWVIATYNEGYEGMVKMNKAIHQRFDHILWDYDPEVEKELIKSENVRRIGTCFRAAYKDRKIHTPVGTSLLQRINRNIAIQGVDMALEIFLGMFDARDRPVAEEILNAQSITATLKEDEKQRMINEGMASVPDEAEPLAAALDENPF